LRAKFTNDWNFFVREVGIAVVSVDSPNYVEGDMAETVRVLQNMSLFI